MRPEEWIVSNDTGTSSKLIWCVMMGVKPRENIHFYTSTPSDPSDFGRCYRLLENFPHWKERLPEVAFQYPKWKPMVDNWSEMEKLYLEELPSGRCPKLYEFMKTLRG